MNKQVKVTFWALVGVFLIVLSFYLIPVARESIQGAAFILGAGIVFHILGAALIYFTVKSNVRGRLKKFMLLTGASAAGIPVSVILHNLIYGLFIHFFGENFWERTGMSDEPVFFVLATIICPLAFLIGVVGTAIIMTRR